MLGVVITSLLIKLTQKTTRKPQRAQASLAEADHYSHIAHCIMCMKRCEAAKRQQCCYALHYLGGERLKAKGSRSLPAP